MLDSANYNSSYQIDMSKFNMGVPHAKLLNFLIKNDNQIKKKKINFYALGKTYHIGASRLLINDLKKENAIVDDSQTISITEKGLELLEYNKHLLKRKPEKTHSNKGIPTPHDIQITNYLKKRVADNTICTFTINDAVKDLGFTKQIVSYRIKRLKDAGYLDFTPRKYNTIKILKEIE